MALAAGCAISGGGGGGTIYVVTAAPLLYNYTQGRRFDEAACWRRLHMSAELAVLKVVGLKVGARVIHG